MKKQKNERRNIRILCWMDSPAVSTGFATVARGIFKTLGQTGKYDIDIIGVNDRGGWKDFAEHPYRIYPAKIGTEIDGDYFGRPRLISSVLGKDNELAPPWDIVFLLNDPFIIEQPVPVFNQGVMQIIKEAQEQFKAKLPPEFMFKTVYYIPIDSPLRGNWLEHAISLADYPIAYTKYGKQEIEQADIKLEKPTRVADRTDIIYHGADLKTFHPITPDERKEFRSTYFKGVVYDHTFIVTVVARNQMRKDIPRAMAIFKEFQKRRPDAFLYLHCQMNDAWGNLHEYARNWNLEFGKDWGVPARFDAGIGVSVETLNKIYASSDVILSTTLGEGWGFYNTEGFATKTVVVAPDNTIHPEILGYDGDVSDISALCDRGIRGVPYKSGSNMSEWATYGPADLERVRPLGNVEDAVKKLVWVYDNPDKVEGIKERAYEWVQNYTWDKIAKQWDDKFTAVYNDLENERAKVIRNIANKANTPPVKSKRTK